MIEDLCATGINDETETVADNLLQQTDGAGFDLVFDSFGGANMANLFEVAALNGQIPRPLPWPNST